MLIDNEGHAEDYTAVFIDGFSALAVWTQRRLSLSGALTVQGEDKTHGHIEEPSTAGTDTRVRGVTGRPWPALIGVGRGRTSLLPSGCQVAV